MNKTLLFIIGKRKAGTSLLYNIIDDCWRSGSKDGSWDDIYKESIDFQSSELELGIIAKADALLNTEKLLSFINEFDGCINLIMMERNEVDRCLSYIAHERKSSNQSIQSLKKSFYIEEKKYKKNLIILKKRSNCKFKTYKYEDLIEDKLSILNRRLITKNSRVYNSSKEILPFWKFINLITSAEVYKKNRNSFFIRYIKNFYYRYFYRTTKNNKLNFIKGVVLGSVDGPIDGQRKLTSIYLNKTNINWIKIDYNGHRKIKSLFLIPYQLLIVLFIVFFRPPDIVYICSSRTILGATRDLIFLNILCIFGRPKIVSHIHGADFFKFIKKTPYLSKHLLEKVDALIFLSPSLIEYPDILKKNEIYSLSNPRPRINKIDIKALSGSRACGFISSFIPGKGLETFLALVNSRSDMNFIVAGGVNAGHADYGKKVSLEVEKLHDSGNLNYLGYVDNPQKFFSKVDFMLFPTSYESEAFPGVLVEALCYGVIPVVRRHNALEKIFNEAPVIWFSKEEELASIFSDLLCLNEQDINDMSSKGIQWSEKKLPEQELWAEAIDGVILKNLGLLQELPKYIITHK